MHLCWSRRGLCYGEPVDWRARALKVEAICADLYAALADCHVPDCSNKATWIVHVLAVWPDGHPFVRRFGRHAYVSMCDEHAREHLAEGGGGSECAAAPTIRRAAAILSARRARGAEGGR
jgi:hypothetical protein